MQNIFLLFKYFYQINIKYLSGVWLCAIQYGENFILFSAVTFCSTQPESSFNILLIYVYDVKLFCWIFFICGIYIFSSNFILMTFYCKVVFALIGLSVVKKLNFKYLFVDILNTALAFCSSEQYCYYMKPKC